MKLVICAVLYTLYLRVEFLKDSFSSKLKRWMVVSIQLLFLSTTVLFHYFIDRVLRL